MMDAIFYSQMNKNAYYYDKIIFAFHHHWNIYAEQPCCKNAVAFSD